jgi:hypothetical protein
MFKLTNLTLNIFQIYFKYKKVKESSMDIKQPQRPKIRLACIYQKTIGQ